MAPGALAKAPDADVSILVSLGSVGRTTVEFRYRISFNGELVGTGCVLMVCVSGTPGNFKPSPIPERVRRLAPTDTYGDRAFMQRGLQEVPKETPPPSSGSFTYSMVVRHSDEDTNKHANHAAYARFFEDAREVAAVSDHLVGEIARSGDLNDMMIEYVSEVRAMDHCDVVLSPSKGAEGSGAIDVHVYRTNNKKGLLARGRMYMSAPRTRSAL